MLGRVVKFKLIQDAPGLFWRKSLVKRSGTVGVEIIIDQNDFFTLRIALIGQPFESMGIILAGTPISYQYLAKAG